MKQIPTKFRDKIPKDLGYPMNSKKLSESLLGVPQYDSLKAEYRCRDEFWASSYRRKLKEQKEVTVVEVRYLHPLPTHSSANSSIESGFYEPSWSILVVAIPKEHLHEAKTLIQLYGFPDVRNWLFQLGVQPEHREHKAKLHYDLAKKSLRFESVS